MKRKSNKKILICIADEIHIEGISILKNSGFAVVELYGLKNDSLINQIAGIEFAGNPVSAIIVRSVRNIGRDDILGIRKNTSVRLICTASSGFDNIDVSSSIKNGVVVLNVPDGNFVSAAEHTMAVILSIIKNVSRADQDMKEGIFDAARYVNTELMGRTLGIIGVGRVGSYVAKLARAFQMNVLGNDIKKSLIKKYPWIKFVKLEKLLRTSDIITIHTPLDSSTYDLINIDKVNLIPAGSILINCARGGIVNETALAEALKLRKLYYAGLDVFVNEPNILSKLKGLDNIILTPHLAGKTTESKVRISVQLANRIVAHYKKLRFKSKNSTLKN